MKILQEIDIIIIELNYFVKLKNSFICLLSMSYLEHKTNKIVFFHMNIEKFDFFKSRIFFYIFLIQD